MASATSRVFAVMQRVIAAHDALQLGELADHAGGQIGLAQKRRALRFRPCRCIGADDLRDFAGQRFDALHALQLRAELGVEDDAFEVGDAAFQRALRSWSQKNFASDSRARSTRSLPATISLPPSSASMLATTTKLLASLLVRVAQREIFLMRAHGGLKNFRRHIHEGLVDLRRSAPPAIRQAPSLRSARPSSSINSSPSANAFCLRLVQDDLAPLGGIQDHMRVAQLRLVIVEAGEPRSRPSDKEPWPRVIVPAHHAGDLERNHFAVEGGNDGVQRPHPAERRHLRPSASISARAIWQSPRAGFRPARRRSARPLRSITAT